MQRTGFGRGLVVGVAAVDAAAAVGLEGEGHCCWAQVDRGYLDPCCYYDWADDRSCYLAEAPAFPASSEDSYQAACPCLHPGSSPTFDP